MRIMKDSGIAWIGEIPIDWNKNKVFRIFDIIGSGTTPKSNNEQNFIGTIKWIQSGDINGAELFDCKTSISENAFNSSSALKIYRAPYIIIAMYGASVGNISISNIDACVNQACCVLGGRVYNLKYAYYALKTAKDYLVWKAVGGGQPNISQDTIKQLWLPDPSQKAKERIARFLDVKCSHIDSVIEKTRAAVEEYKKLKQAVITQAVTKGIRPNREMKDSGIEWIEEIPREWRMTKIKVGVSKVGSGKTPSGGAEVYADEGIIFLRSQNIYDTGIVIDSPTFITNETDEEMKNTRVQPNDVLLNITGGSIGRCCIFPNYLKQANVNQHVSIVRVIKTIILSEFMHLYWISDLGKMSIQLFQTGGNREGMTADAIKNSPIAIPDLPEQSEIVAYLDEKTAAIDSLIQKKEQLITELEAYKKSLIYEYVTGKKEVPVHAH